MLSQTKKIILFIFLCALTAGAHFWIDGYRNVSEQLLLNQDFASGLQSWQVHQAPLSGAVKVQDNILQIQALGHETSVQVWQDVHTILKSKRMRIRATLKTEDIRGNGKQWSKARLVLVQPGALPTLTNYFYYVLTALTGTHDWRMLDKVVTVSREAPMFQFRIQFPHCTGTFFVKEVSLYQVEERDIFVWCNRLLTSMWAFFIFILFFPLLKTKKRVVAGFAVAVFGVIVIGTTMPAGIKNYLKYALLRKIESYFFSLQAVLRQSGYEITYGLPFIDITKIAHSVLFFLLTLLLVYGNPDRSKWRQTGDIFMLACATELIQLFIDGRSPLWTDVLIDMTGGLFALGILGIPYLIASVQRRVDRR